MDTTVTSRSRRSFLALGAGTALTAALAASGTASAAPSHLTAELGALEEQYAARLGVYAHDLGTGRTVRYRAGERFPLCSVFKGIAAAAVLRDLDHDGSELAKRVHYTQAEVDRAGYAPVTGLPEHVAGGLTVAELCAAAVGESDNAAANLLLRELGGPTAVTRFCRSTGDRVTRLDRWEPELNSAEPWRRTDTTSPQAIGTTYGRLVAGRVLAPDDRARLTGWLVANTTNTERFRAGLPADWVLADKTGGGSEYGVANDVGVVRPPGRAPIVLSVLSTTHAAEGPSQSALVARAAGLVAGHLVPGS
ncbi:class A beta-lactamase [Streptomyces sp. SID5785]|uniref:class A beta-lactamase n=1 Tax=Streptomyces sp. SID5785 TaxID=2690309 RepID=UPI001EFF4EE9|nr:class A beta-lactamase [Streptomyces sp. SID5785]